MSPHHFARLTRNHKLSEAERGAEEKVENAIKTAVAIVAVPFKYITDKAKSNRPDKP